MEMEEILDDADAPLTNATAQMVVWNPLILESIFKSCNSKELGTFRLVCKLWNRVALPFWSENSGPIMLYERSRDAVFERNKHLTIESFIQVYGEEIKNDNTENPADNIFISQSGWPFQRFKLMFFRNLQYSSHNGLLFKFWSSCGPWITELQIVGCRLNDYGAYKDVLFCKFTPQLIRFKFSCQYEGASTNSSTENGSYGRHESLKSLSFLYCTPRAEWIELLSRYPDLTCLEIFSPYRLTNWENELNAMFESLAVLRLSNAGILTVEALKIHVAGMNQNLEQDNIFRVHEVLSPCNLPLKSLSVDAHLLRGADNHLQILFKAYQNTLEKFKIRDFLGEPPLHFPDLTMPFIKELTLIGKSFASMEILKFTPNLRVLHVINPWKSRAMDRYMLKGFIKSEDKLNLTFLRDLRYDYDCTPCGMINLVSWMPNVEVLQMPLTNETFRLVCRYWRNLKHLVVQRDNLNDDGICGAVRVDEKISRVASVISQHQPIILQGNITNLQGLQSFVMENHRYNERTNDIEEIISSSDILPTRCTEKSFVHGFLKLPYLQKLWITVEEETVSAHLLQILKAKIRETCVVQMQNPFRRRF